MTCPKCDRYEDCDAPLCPRDEQSVRHGAWFPDEPICSLLRNTPDWVRIQRKLRRLSAEVGYFTVRMLEAAQYPSRIKEGADPERDVAGAARAWLRAHKRAVRKGVWCGPKTGKEGAGVDLAEVAETTQKEES